MCLALRTDQHIQLTFVSEQMLPRSDANGLTYHECFDIILRSFSEQPIERLFALSPFDGKFEVPMPDPCVGWAHTFHDWIFKRDPQCLRPDAAQYELHFRAEETAGQNHFMATRLTPVVNEPSWSAAAPPKQVAALVGTDMTFKEISFADGALIQPFDPAREQETTYWIRLKLNGKPAGGGQPAVFGSKGKTLFHVRPCCIFSPEEVISNLAAKFDALMLQPAMKTDAANAKQAVIDQALRKPGSSVQVMDHRISIVTGQHGVLVFNTHHEGACSFHAVEETKDGNNDGHFSRNYFTGAEYFPNTDALTLARSALDYLQRYAKEEATAKTKEEVTSAINGYHHPNVAHVIDVLKEKQFIKEVEKQQGRFYVDSVYKQQQLESPADAGADMLGRLYEPETEKENGRRGFSPRATIKPAPLNRRVTEKDFPPLKVPFPVRRCKTRMLDRAVEHEHSASGRG